ncbi:hypothetical protein ZYGM_000403 [Zygosaccharomyces mellis]|uniref:YHL026C-like protein n=1 Tax=Zygosaccharomyces mellis TaxID=42258 RepID=A0A4C2ECE9_9SACH|nr:hypothetical protein ZYGM_000403 [Zygosaccharomyces mellis]
MKEETRKSKWYIFYYLFENGLISAMVAGGSEFGIAYAMYYDHKSPLTLWAFPHTLSGDCALSHFIQVGLTWYAEELTIGWDALNGKTPILPFSKEYLPKNRIIRWYFEVENGIVADEDEPENNTFKKYMTRQLIRYPQKSWFFNLCEWLIRKAIRALIVGAIIWAVEWPITMGIMAGTGTRIGSHDYKFHGYYPEVMKLIYGFVLGLISTPTAILVVVLRDQWYRLYVQSEASSGGLLSPGGLEDKSSKLQLHENSSSSKQDSTVSKNANTEDSSVS